MPDARARAAATLLAAALLPAACASPQDRIDQRREKIESLRASARLLAADWLAGELSPTYARTAFDAIGRQVEQQRAALAARPRTLADPQGAALSRQAERLSRTVAAMGLEVEQHDDGALRDGLAALAPGGDAK